MRFVELQEWPNVISACLNEVGFATTVEDGGINYSGDTSQQKAYDLARYTCKAMFPIEPKYLVPLDAGKLSALYDDYTTRLVPCLEERGVVVPAAPSRQTFIDSYYSGTTWEPYANTHTLSEDEWRKLNLECPQVPDGYYDSNH